MRRAGLSHLPQQRELGEESVDVLGRLVGRFDAAETLVGCDLGLGRTEVSKKHNRIELGERRFPGEVAAYGMHRVAVR